MNYEFMVKNNKRTFSSLSIHFWVAYLFKALLCAIHFTWTEPTHCRVVKWSHVSVQVNVKHSRSAL